jgi:hypothetical protein
LRCRPWAVGASGIKFEVQHGLFAIGVIGTPWESGSRGVSLVVGLLEEKGRQLSFPRTTKITSSRHGHLRELRIQYKDDPYRILYAFDPRRVAPLLIGGSQAGDDRWYEKHVPVADSRYNEHFETLQRD